MILNLERFVADAERDWQELDRLLVRMEEGGGQPLSLGEIEQFHYLYEKVSSDLAQVSALASEPQLTEYLESLVARAHAEIHETRRKGLPFRPWQWVSRTFPMVFRRHIRAFWLATALMMLGAILGAYSLARDPAVKAVIMPFPHLLMTPAERVAMEEQRGGADDDYLDGAKATFSSELMTHNTRVGILTLALGITYGVGTTLVLFYNGVILGAVAFDFLAAGEGEFLAGWLLPHGVVEIPAILMAGQAGLVLAFALLGWDSRHTLGFRLRKIAPDLVTLITGVALLLIWAGLVEAFLSQYHEPVIPYAAKISFGVVEFCLLTAYLAFAGRTPARSKSS